MASLAHTHTLKGACEGGSLGRRNCCKQFATMLRALSLHIKRRPRTMSPHARGHMVGAQHRDSCFPTGWALQCCT
eukprot:608087-Alexandrium_andersonii.AAC.1